MPRRAGPDHLTVFLSYSRNDGEAAINLRAQLQRCGLSVFKDDERIRAGDLWLDRLQEAVGAAVRRAGRARQSPALDRRRDASGLRPLLCSARRRRAPADLSNPTDGTEAETLPAFLRLFQMTPWNGADALPERLLKDIRHRTIVTNEIAFKDCPFVGLAAFGIDQAHLFFGRQKETPDALACFDTRRGAATVRWLEINGNSGSGKSSLMQAGVLPWWMRGGYGLAPRSRAGGGSGADDAGRAPGRNAGWSISPTRSARRWARLLKTFRTATTPFVIGSAAANRTKRRFCSPSINSRSCSPLPIRESAAGSIGCSLAPWKMPTARCSSFPPCAQTFDRFAEDLPRLVAVRNRLGRPWTLAPIGADGLREVIEGPARLANLNVSEIKAAMVAEARMSRVPYRWSRTRYTGYGRSARAIA